MTLKKTWSAQKNNIIIYVCPMNCLLMACYSDNLIIAIFMEAILVLVGIFHAKYILKTILCSKIKLIIKLLISYSIFLLGLHTGISLLVDMSDEMKTMYMIFLITMAFQCALICDVLSSSVNADSKYEDNKSMVYYMTGVIKLILACGYLMAEVIILL